MSESLAAKNNNSSIHLVPQSFGGIQAWFSQVLQLQSLQWAAVKVLASHLKVLGGLDPRPSSLRGVGRIWSVGLRPLVLLGLLGRGHCLLFATCVSLALSERANERGRERERQRQRDEIQFSIPVLEVISHHFCRVLVIKTSELGASPHSRGRNYTKE